MQVYFCYSRIAKTNQERTTLGSFKFQDCGILAMTPAICHLLILRYVCVKNVPGAYSPGPPDL